MFFKRRIEKKNYDKASMKPVIRVSICHEEQVAGFKNIATGEFKEIMLIKNEDDLLVFKETYGITGEIEKIY